MSKGPHTRRAILDQALRLASTGGLGQLSIGLLAGAAKMSESLKAGHPITLPRTDTIADGLMPVRPGDLTFEHLEAFGDCVVTVGDAGIARAAVWLFH